MSGLWELLNAQWEYVGTFEGCVSNEDGGAPDVCYYILSQRGKHRRCTEVNGLNGNQSRHSVWAKSQVKAWLSGGPLPEGIEERSAEPEYRPKATLIVFPGGKPSASNPHPHRH